MKLALLLLLLAGCEYPVPVAPDGGSITDELPPCGASNAGDGFYVSGFVCTCFQQGGTGTSVIGWYWQCVGPETFNADGGP